MVEHHLAKVDVEGSNPFARSKFYKRLADLMQELKSGRSGVVVKNFQELEQCLHFEAVESFEMVACEDL